MSRLLVASALVGSLAACGGGELVATELPACGQLRDGHWDQRLVLPGASGVSPTVNAIERMPDGSIIAGGWFDAMSGTAAQNVARWDGARWSPLGAGLPGQVTSLAVDDRGQLWAVGDYFGGRFPFRTLAESESGPYLARWTGTEWTYVAREVYGLRGVAPVDGGVALYGSFWQQTNMPASGIAIWRDGAWSSTGLVSGSNSVSDVVRTSDGLCASGQLETTSDQVLGVACWDGSTWSRMGTGMIQTFSAETLARGSDGRWYVGGYFALSDGVGERYGIARFEDDGQWRALDGGVHGRDTVPGDVPHVTSIAVDGEDLVVAGYFASVGPSKLPAFHLARWSPTEGWSAMTAPTDLFGRLSTVVVTDERTYVGGPFRRIGAQPGGGIAAVDADRVHALPDTSLAPPRLGAISDMTATSDGLILGGRFKETLDAEAADSLLRFDGEWHVIEGVPLDYSISTVSLGGNDYAVRSGANLYRKLGDDDVELLTDRFVTGPMVVDGNGTLLFLVATDPLPTIVKATREDTSFVTVAPGTVVAMAIYEGEIVVVTTNPLLGAQTVYRWRDDSWQLIGAWADYTSNLVVSPALGLVAATEGGTRIWNGSTWRLVSSALVYDMAACSDGVVAAIDEGDGSRLSFLDDPDGAWTYYGEPRGEQWWQITPTERGIYIGTQFFGASSSTDSPMGFARWTTHDDTGW